MTFDNTTDKYDGLLPYLISIGYLISICSRNFNSKVLIHMFPSLPVLLKFGDLTMNTFFPDKYAKNCRREAKGM